MATTTLPPPHLPSSPPATPTSDHCPNCGFHLPEPQADMTAAATLAESQRKIQELEAQVRLLNEKAAAAVDKWADYEDELVRLRGEVVAANQNTMCGNGGGPKQAMGMGTGIGPISGLIPSPPPSATLFPSVSQQQAQQQYLQTGGTLLPLPSPGSRSSFGRISDMLTRKSIPALLPSAPQLKPLPGSLQHTPASTRAGSPTDSLEGGVMNGNHLASPAHIPRTPAPPQSPSAAEVSSALESAAELAVALAREQSLRRKAEHRLDAANSRLSTANSRLDITSKEVEELSASLFEEANEMVASERRERARLEARVAVLEGRDGRVRERLDSLERAVDRCGRARGVLGRGGGRRGSDMTV